jgi:hypothetical protein
MQGSPSPQNTEFIKTPSHASAITKGKRLDLNDPSGKRPSAEAPGMAKKGKESGKDNYNPKDEDESEMDNKVIDNTDLDNRMRGLRGMSQLHRAAVADRFRFGASAASGEPMVLRAASLAQATPGDWASDAAFLNKFHNSAIRIVDPSGLDVLKESEKKKKKKKKDEDDEEDLKMSDSGLFVARYPVAQDLIALRRLKKKAFPEADLEQETGPSKQELHAAAAAQLKANFGGFLLSRVRDVSEENQAEQDAALAASGY